MIGWGKFYRRWSKTSRSTVGRATLGMSVATAVSISVAFVTSPLQARALGPAGRGDLAAVLVVLGLAPSILDVGMGAYVARERARGRDTGRLFGTVLLMGVVFSVAGMALAIPVGHLIGHGRPVVTRFIEIGLWLSPVAVSAQALGLVAVAERRWGLVNRLRLTPPVVALVGVVGFYLAGHLTVATAAAIAICAGLLTSAQTYTVLRRTRHWRYDASLVKPALRFGSRAWAATIFAQGNGYVDQLMMTTLTAPRQLGFYAVATTISSVSLPLVVAPLSASRFADVASGRGPEQVPQLGRIALVATAIVGLGVAAAGPFAILLLFGSRFAPAIPMLGVLLVSSIPGSLGAVLIQMLDAGGRPSFGLRAQGSGLVLAVPLLAVALPAAGGLGASVVDVVSNTTVALLALRYAHETFGSRVSDYIRPRRSDLAAMWLSARGRAAT